MSDAPDRIDHSLAQWAEQRPDLDLSGIAVTLRLVLLGKLIEQQAAETFAPFHLQTWEFDVLATLRRQGPPHTLSAGELARSVLLTCSGMTHRLNRLEARGLVERLTEPGDRRRVLVRLTGAGRKLTDEVVGHRARAAADLVAGLNPDERGMLESLLRSLQARLETPRCRDDASGERPDGGDPALARR